MRPDLPVGIQLGRVRRQGEELELAVLRFDKVPDQLGLVDRMAHVARALTVAEDAALDAIGTSATSPSSPQPPRYRGRYADAG